MMENIALAGILKSCTILRNESWFLGSALGISRSGCGLLKIRIYCIINKEPLRDNHQKNDNEVCGFGIK